MKGQVKALGRCTGRCDHCLRRCNGTRFGAQTHRFDCCGEVAAHVPVLRGGLGQCGSLLSEPRWAVVRNPMGHGYLTGPSRTVKV